MSLGSSCNESERDPRLSGHVVVCWGGTDSFGMLDRLVELGATENTVIALVSPDVWSWAPACGAALEAVGIVRIEGRPDDRATLLKSGVAEARGVLVPLHEEAGHEADDGALSASDAAVLRTALAVRSVNPHVPVYAEVASESTRRFLTFAGVRDIVSCEMMGARALSQAMLEHGVTAVYDELLESTGHTCEPYTVGAPEPLRHVRFGTLAELGVGRGLAIVGLVNLENEVILNPDADARLGDGDRLLVLGADIEHIRQALRGMADET